MDHGLQGSNALNNYNVILNRTSVASTYFKLSFLAIHFEKYVFFKISFPCVENL